MHENFGVNPPATPRQDTSHSGVVKEMKDFERESEVAAATFEKKHALALARLKDLFTNKALDESEFDPSRQSELRGREYLSRTVAASVGEGQTEAHVYKNILPLEPAAVEVVREFLDAVKRYQAEEGDPIENAGVEIVLKKFGLTWFLSGEIQWRRSTKLEELFPQYKLFGGPKVAMGKF